MKILVTSTGKNLDSAMDSRFGRCPFFFIATIEDGNIITTEAFDNEGVKQGHGAGIRAGRQVAELKADVLITGHLGPKATMTLNELEIPSYEGKGTVKECIDSFISDKLNKITETGEDHRGIIINNQETQEDINESDNKKIYFPILDNNGLDSLISEHFGHCPFVGIYDTKDRVLSVSKNELDHSNMNKSPVDQVMDNFAPDIVIAKGMGSRARTLFNEKKVPVKTGNFKTVREFIENKNNLEFLNEDCKSED